MNRPCQVVRETVIRPLAITRLVAAAMLGMWWIALENVERPS